MLLKVISYVAKRDYLVIDGCVSGCCWLKESGADREQAFMTRLVTLLHVGRLKKPRVGLEPTEDFARGFQVIPL